MKIAKALKEKNRLKGEIAALKKKITAQNRKVKGNPQPYDVQQLLKELQEKTAQLIQMKSDITHVNQPVQQKIYRLAELKALAAFYKTIPVNEGKDAVTRYSDDIFDFEVQVKAPELDKIIVDIERQIEALQDELDVFNHATELA